MEGGYESARATDIPDAAIQMQAAVTAAPKFAIGWHALGVAQEKMEKLTEARDSYQHAIEADPKMFAAYVTLARLCLKTKDWQGAAKAADELIKVDKRRPLRRFISIRPWHATSLRIWTARQASVQEAIQDRKIPRAEYVLGRILEAKGDAAGAREHISKYLELDKNTPDADAIRTAACRNREAGSGGSRAGAGSALDRLSARALRASSACPTAAPCGFRWS